MFRSVILITLIPAMFACGQTTKSSTPAPQTLAPIKSEPIIIPGPQSPQPEPIPAPAPQSPQPEPIPIPPASNQNPQQPANNCPPLGNPGCVGGVANPPIFQIPIFGNGGLGNASQQRCYKVSDYICQLENAVIGHINGFRNARNLAGFFPDYQMAFSARQWSFEQARNLTPALSPLPDRLAVMAIEFPVVAFPNLAAENIAGSRAAVPDVVINAKILFDIMMADAATANNVMGPNLAAGVGIVQRGGRFFLTILFAN